MSKIIYLLFFVFTTTSFAQSNLRKNNRQSRGQGPEAYVQVVADLMGQLVDTYSSRHSTQISNMLSDIQDCKHYQRRYIPSCLKTKGSELIMLLSSSANKKCTGYFDSFVNNLLWDGRDDFHGTIYPGDQFVLLNPSIISFMMSKHMPSNRTNGYKVLMTSGGLVGTEGFIPKTYVKLDNCN